MAGFRLLVSRHSPLHRPRHLSQVCSLRYSSRFYMAKNALPCVVCGRTLRNVMDETDNQPSDGVVCQTRGNYGSTVFDSFNGEKLEFNLCDPCLVKADEQGRIRPVQ